MVTSHRAVRACLITNPKSGKGGIDLTDVLPVLSEQGWEIVVRRKEHGGDATALAREAARDGFDVVVDCAGDGTLSEIVSGVVGTDIAVGTIPGGTVNLWSKEVGISQRLRVAAMQLAVAERRRVDVGHLTVNGKHGAHFILMAGLGADAAIVQRVDKRLKNRIGGPLATGLAAVKAIPAFHALPVELELDGGIRWEGRVSQVIVGNTRRYAGFTRITNRALVDDGQLDICLITATNPLAASRQLASLLLRQRPSAASAEYYRSATMTLRAPRLLPVQVDGGRLELDEDPDDKAEYTFTVRAQAVSLLVPRTYGGELFQPEFRSDTHARPALAYAGPADHDGASGHNGNDGHNGQKGRMRIVAVGTDTLTAEKLKNGRVVTVQVERNTVLRDRDGDECPLRDALSSLVTGDLIAVKGKKAQHTIHARRVTLLDARER